uniref:ATP-dependent DNA helicase n=1 Tax=Salix viminalis TaxID=40686 RepID=A0A6N2M4E8_SALVM
MLKGDVQGSSTGKIILPSSVTGIPRYMVNNYQDAMAICRAYEIQDLLYTCTEIQRELNKSRAYKSEDKPDIITRVFISKLLDMLKFIKSAPFWPKQLLVMQSSQFISFVLSFVKKLLILLKNCRNVHAIEFQKRVASSGIASLLLPNGRTAHSRFKIPLSIDESSTCAIKKNTHLSSLLQKTSLIVFIPRIIFPINEIRCLLLLKRRQFL